MRVAARVSEIKKKNQNLKLSNSLNRSLSFVVQLLPPRDSDLLSSQPFIFRPFAHDTATPRAPLSSHGHPALPGSQPSFATYRARLLASSRYPTPLALFLSCPYVTVSRVKSLFPNCNISKRLNLLFLLFLCSFVCLLL